MDDRIAEQPRISVPNQGLTAFSVAAPATFNWPEAILSAFQRPMGARFYRCALQVNTPLQNSFKGFDSNHAKHSAAYKRDYGMALAKKCKKAGIDVVGICDHNSVDYLDAIRQQLKQENIFVFPGFEVASTEGLHVLCLFDLDTPSKELDHVLTALCLPPQERWATGVGHAPRQSPMSFPEILEQVQRQRRGICIAAHIDRENGLLSECARTTRVQYFADGNLLAGQISGARKNLTPFYRKVLAGKLTHYRRARPLALVNCLDVYNLKDLGLPACSAWIKMSTPSLEGLWQAFLDPESRLRLVTEAEDHKTRREQEAENFKLVAMSWKGGFLDGCGMRFNENLNCLIGGRGAGKSTVIESLRFVLDQKPIGKSARDMHANLLKTVLQDGTRVSLLVQSQSPQPGYYRIERVYMEKLEKSEEPVVFDEHGEQCALKVFDLFSRVDIFGQHEIAEIAREPQRQLELLHRFRRGNAARAQAQKQEYQLLLAQNRQELLRVLQALQTLEEQLSRLPGIEEELRRFRDLGVEQKLKEDGLLAREEQILRSYLERVQQLRKVFEPMRRQLEMAGAPAGPSERLPNHDLLQKMAALEARLRESLQALITAGEETWQRAYREWLAIRQEWETRKRGRLEEYQKILRELQKEEVNGVEYVNLSKELERLKPLRAQFQQLDQKRQELEKQRRRLLQKWEEAQEKLFKIDRATAEHVSLVLAGKVRVTLIPAAQNQLLSKKLKEMALGLRKEFFNLLHEASGLQLREFIATMRAGKEKLKRNYRFSEAQAEILARIPEATLLEMEEMDLSYSICIELNVARSEAKPQWRALSDISIGQKATAILLLLLPESGTPLIIDQPEDDLDNRFIAETIIPKLREEKQKRQFLFATHNANIPVLGDAEQIIGLEAAGDGATGKAQIHKNSLGSIDCEPVKELIEQILEGGQQAFETRRAKYGFQASLKSWI